MDLFKTRFINPDQQTLSYFESLKIKYQDLADWRTKNYMDPSPDMQGALMQAYPNIPLEQALTTLQKWTEENFEKLQKVIVLYAPPDSQCELSVTGIRSADGTDVHTNPGVVITALPAGPNVNIWETIHRFIRLWRKLGWSMSDLDKTLTALGATDITTDVLQQLAQVEQLQTDVNVASCPASEPVGGYRHLGR